MNKYTLVSLILVLFQLLFINSTFAQTKISGKIFDDHNKPVPGANIFIKGSYDGSSSDANGAYSFIANDTGEIIISVTFIGYEPLDYTTKISGKELVYNPIIKEIVNQLKAVTISAGAIEASDAKRGTVLKPLDIVTTANASGDIYGALKTLPGAQLASESEGLFVRGGTGNETKTIIDGMEVAHPYYSGVPDVAARGRFSPFLFKGTIFSTGGYSAQYGDAMSSALVLESQDIADRTSSTMAFSSVGLGFGHSHLFDSANASIGFDVNYTNLAPYFAMVKQDVDFNVDPVFTGGSMNFRIKTSKTGLFKFYAYDNYSHIAVFQDNLDSLEYGKTFKNRFEIKNNDIYTNATYKEYLSQKWTLFLGTSYSQNNDDIKFDTYPLKKNDNYLQGKVLLTSYIGKLSSIHFGGEIHKWHNEFILPSYSSVIMQNAFTIDDIKTAGIVESDIYFSTRLVARLGARAENSNYINHSNIAPRTSIAYKTSEFSQVSFAYGDFYQLPIDSLLFRSKTITYEKATHYILNYQHIDDNRTFRVEYYYKKYADLVKYDLNNTPLGGPIHLNNSGNGFARGIDVFFRDKKTVKNSDIWISYTYLDTKRNFLNFPSEEVPNFASKHTANIVFKKYVIPIRTYFGATYTYATGRPYYNVNNPIFSADYPSYPNSMTPNYTSLGLNASYLTKIGGWFSVIVFSVSNVLGTDNIYNYRYSTDGSFTQPVRAQAPRFIFAGLFMSIGTDRSKDAVNNNN